MLCSQGRIPGAERFGNYMWNIPQGTSKPSDFRSVRYIHNKDVRTGANDYTSAVTFDKQTKPDAQDKISIIRNILRYQDFFLTSEQIENIVFHNTDNSFSLPENIPYSLSVRILDLFGTLSQLPVYLNMQSLIDLNRSICRNMYSKESVEDEDMIKIDCLIQMYRTDWVVLHPIARAVFVFDNILKNNLFKKNNIETAFMVLQNELIINNLKCAVFTDGNIDELKGALVSSAFRGNLQKVISLLLNSVSN